MSSGQIELWTEKSSDPELIAGVRSGDSGAFGVLYERHYPAARAVAIQYTNSVTDAEDVVQESFSRVFRALQRGDGPDLAFRAYLFTIVRRTGLDIIDQAKKVRPQDDFSPIENSLGESESSEQPTLASFENTMVSEAFSSLPERWQAVLWYTEVEEKSPREIAPLLGLSANGVAALAYRAREALRQAYLQQHLGATEEETCHEINTKLGSYVRGGLSKRDNAKVEEHVDECIKCAALYAELRDVNRGLRLVIVPLFMGAAGVAALETGLPIGGIFAADAASALNGGVVGTDPAGTSTGGSGRLKDNSASLAGVLVASLLALAAIAGVTYGIVNNLRSNDSDATPAATPSPQAPTTGPDTNPTPEVSPSVSPSTEPDDEIDDDNVKPDVTGRPISRPTDGRPTTPGENGNTGGNGGKEQPGKDPKPQPSPGPEVPEATANLDFGAFALGMVELSTDGPRLNVGITNSGDGDASNVQATITLPNGVIVRAPLTPFSARSATIAAGPDTESRIKFTSGEWSCSMNAEQSEVQCLLASLPSKSDSTLDLELDIVGSLANDAETVIVLTSGEQSLTKTLPTVLIDPNAPQQRAYFAEGKYDIAYAGAPLIICDPDADLITNPDCNTILNYNGDGSVARMDNSGVSGFKHLIELPGTTSSAETELDLPPGAVVTYAQLDWASVFSGTDGLTGSVTTAKIRGPQDPTWTNLTADTFKETHSGGLTYYESRKDVTAIVSQQGKGTWAVADIALPINFNGGNGNYYGGYALTVVYTHPSLIESQVAVFNLEGTLLSGTTSVALPFGSGAQGNTKIGVVAWEGDRSGMGDYVSLNGSNLESSYLVGGVQVGRSTTNAFDSTAFGWKYANSIGVDAKQFMAAPVNRGLNHLTFGTTGDRAMLSSFSVVIHED